MVLQLSQAVFECMCCVNVFVPYRVQSRSSPGSTHALILTLLEKGFLEQSWSKLRRVGLSGTLLQAGELKCFHSRETKCRKQFMQNLKGMRWGVILWTIQLPLFSNPTITLPLLLFDTALLSHLFICFHTKEFSCSCLSDSQTQPETSSFTPSPLCRERWNGYARCRWKMEINGNQDGRWKSASQEHEFWG